MSLSIEACAKGNRLNKTFLMGKRLPGVLSKESMNPQATLRKKLVSPDHHGQSDQSHLLPIGRRCSTCR